MNDIAMTLHATGPEDHLRIARQLKEIAEDLEEGRLVWASGGMHIHIRDGLLCIDSDVKLATLSGILAGELNKPI